MDFVLLLFQILSLVIIFKIILLLYDHYVNWRKLKNIPGSNTCPLFGESLYLMTMNEAERTTWYLKYINRYKEGLFIQWIGNYPAIHIFNPEFLEVILPSTVNIEKGRVYDFIRPWLGNGLLTSTGNQWFHDRRLIGPTFHFNILDQFAVVISEKAQILTKCLERELKKNPGKAIDFCPFSINVALDIICETAMGVDIHAQEAVTEYTEKVHRASKLIVNRMVRPWYWIDWFYYSISPGKQYKAALDTLHKFTKKVINEKKTIRESRNSNIEANYEEDELNINKRKRKAFLDLLLDQNEKDDFPLTDDELRAQVDTFMFEGHDTTAVALTWTLFLLGNYPEYQEKVHEEIEEVFGNSQVPASVKELSQMKYLERVIKETLRIYPSVPVIMRETAENVKIGDYVIPKGTSIAVGIILLHRNPQVWPEPMKFDPDRFLPENMKGRNPYAYIPFSAGPRNCIGQRFALLEEKTVLTEILRKWRVKSIKKPSELSNGGALILRPCEEVFLHFTPK